MQNYRLLLQSKIISSRIALLLIRGIILVLLIYLLIDPKIKWDKISQETPKAVLFIDTSKSIYTHEKLDSIQYSYSISNILDWSTENNIQLDIFQFGNSINRVNDYENLIFSDDNTNFSHIMDTVKYNKFNYVFLATDGITTKGPILESLEIPDNTPIYTIGIGNKYSPPDIKIHSLIYEEQLSLKDSLHLELSVWSNLHESANTSISIQNKDDEIVYYSPINISGEGIKDFSIVIPPEDLSSKYNLSINPVTSEYIESNNTIDFNIDIQDKMEKILLLSGSLSTNTTFLNTVITNLDNTEVTHFFRSNKYNWQKDIQNLSIPDYNLIILDDFPIYGSDITLVEEILDQSRNVLPVLYMEGPNSTFLSHYQLSQLFQLTVADISGENLINLSINNDHRYNFSYMDLPGLPPFKRNHAWESKNNNGNSILEFNDGSLAVYQLNSFTGVFIPEIGISELKSGIKGDKNSITELLSMIIEIVKTPENKIITLFTSKPSVDYGQSVKLELSYSSVINPELIKKDLKLFAQHDSIEYPLIINFNNEENRFYSEFTPINTGEWTVSGRIDLEEYGKIKINEVPVAVQKTHIEDKQLYQNISGLKAISELSNGKYTDIHDLYLLLSQLSFPLETVEEKIELSGVSTNKYWWIIILLFSIEWMIRKRKGLL